MEKALAAVAGHPHRFTASCSRTDAGVHALALVANVFTHCRLDPPTFQRALNANLPHDIRITGLADVPRTFHSRREAVSKTYRYLIWQGPVASPFWDRYAWHLYSPLDVMRLEALAALVPGRRNFQAFTVADGDAKDFEREISAVRWASAPPWLHCTIEGDGFLRHMVRRLVGGMVETAAGRLPEAAFKAALGGDMGQAPNILTAPAKGLWLMEARYPAAVSPRWSEGDDMANAVGFPPPLSTAPVVRARE